MPGIQLQFRVHVNDVSWLENFFARPSIGGEKAPPSPRGLTSQVAAIGNSLKRLGFENSLGLLGHIGKLRPI
jgi:hypothetical protein